MSNPTGPATTSTSSKAPQQAVDTPFRIKSLRKEATWLKMLAYGAPGSGKTTLLGSSCDVNDMCDILQIGCESGNLSLFDNDRIANPERIDEIRITNFQQIPQIHKWLSAHCKYRDDSSPESVSKLIQLEMKFTGRTKEDIEAQGGPKRYRTVMIDSLTEVEAYCLYGLTGLAGEPDLTKLSGGTMKTAEFKEYKQLNNMINLFLRVMRDLPIHFLVCAGENFEKDELSRMSYMPAMTGKLSKQIQAYFDVVGWMHKGKNDEGKEFFRMYLQKGQRHDAKCRFAKFKDPYIDNATMEDLIEAFGFIPPRVTFESEIDAIVES